MNIYQQKTRLKLILLVIALILALVTIGYTNHLANKISSDEEKNIKLWAEAIENKANIVKYTNELFIKIAENERTNVRLWADATTLIATTEDSKVFTFLSDVSSSNKNTPMLLVNEDNRIVARRNVDMIGIEDSVDFRGSLKTMFSVNDPIVIDTRIEDIHIVNYIYYKDSKIYEDLKKILKNLVQSFLSEVVINSASVPVILTDENGGIESTGNIEKNIVANKKLLFARLDKMKKNGKSMNIDLGGQKRKTIYYENSYLYKQLSFFPFIQLLIFAGFLGVAYIAFSSSRKAEENQVWVGMSKETAHQLGTPISSLNAWVELLKITPIEDLIKLNIAEEIEKDVNRLTLVADRFSKIGSMPEKTHYKIGEILHEVVEYYKIRSSQRVIINLYCENENDLILINRELFVWVLENIVNNAIDAMEGIGTIDISSGKINNQYYIDISDTGRGIPKNNFETIFQPGYSTKKRGWGLGLSLSKRIVENYHKGKIFVKESSAENGTIFRINIPIEHPQENTTA